MTTGETTSVTATGSRAMRRTASRAAVPTSHRAIGACPANVEQEVGVADRRRPVVPECVEVVRGEHVRDELDRGEDPAPDRHGQRALDGGDERLRPAGQDHPADGDEHAGEHQRCERFHTGEAR
jgi:hypothetical protein